MKQPRHLAIIMDGNGRWAKMRLLPRIQGHRRGVETLRGVVRAVREKGIASLSVFAFSSENWHRPKDEVEALLKVFVAALGKEARPLAEAGIRLHLVGDRSAFSEELVRAMQRAEEETAEASAMHLNVCVNYGGRWDIANAARQAAAAGLEATPENIERFLCMPWSGPVDLMIRTGGEQRISNFILWQAAYAELWFSDKLWPDFGPDDIDEALDWFAGRERRFGKTSEQVRGESTSAPGAQHA